MFGYKAKEDRDSKKKTEGGSKWKERKKGRAKIMVKPGMMFYFDIRPCMKRLNYEEKGQLFDAMLDYSELGIEPQLEGMSGVAWDFLRPALDRDTDRYEKTVLQRKYANYVKDAKKNQRDFQSYSEWLRDMLREEPAGVSGASRIPGGSQPTTYNLQSTTNNIQHTNSNSGQREPSATRPVFSPPTREDITVYCREMGYSMDADSFLDYYEANGWMIGKSPMKDWKAAVRRWQRKEHEDGKITDPGLWDVGRVP